MSELVPLDFLGNPIKEGDFIVYPGRAGSSLWMRLGIVKKVYTKTDWSKITRTCLQVRTLTYEHGPVPKLGKLAEISEISRVTVVPRLTVSEKHRQILEA